MPTAPTAPPAILRRRLVPIGIGLLVVLAALAWYLRWDLGMRAVTIADPVVRRWVVNETARLSDGVYKITLSPIEVDADARRIGIDTILVLTDAAANLRRATPLPALTVRLHRCALTGVDLARLSRREGLHVARAGCDSVMVASEVPAPRDSAAGGGGFLVLRDDLQLSRDVPTVQFDSIVFPAVEVALGLTGRSGRRTSVAFDRLAVQLDDVRYDPDQPRTERRPLFARNIAVALDAFRGAREANDQLALDVLRADLVTGDLLLRGLAWRPLPGPFTDSLGLTELAFDSLRVDGVDWAAFLARGDALADSVRLGGVRITVAPSAGVPTTTADTSATRWTLERTVRAIDRRMTLRHFAVRDARITEVRGRDTTTTSIGALAINGLVTGPEPATWNGRAPLGEVTIALRDVLRTVGDQRVAVGLLDVAVARGVVRLDSLRAGHVGTDAAFVRARRSRADRLALAVDSMRLAGIETAAWMRRGAIRATRADLHGVALDVYTDKRLPSRGVRARHRTPQGWIVAQRLELQLDTVVVRGRAQYRERAVGAKAPGVLRLDALEARLVNLSTDPARMTDSTPLVATITARMMGRAPFTLEATLPLLAPRFAMRFEGRLGAMPAAALNPFLEGATPVRFTEGTVRSVRFDATVTDGVARGRVVPTYEGLRVETPGVARTGILQGLRRAVAALAANELVLRSDNGPGAKDGTRVGPIAHRWTPGETLLQFMWHALRSGLLAVVKQ
ncbi:MAG TPA: hypothetical protein VFN90_06775 [Gemmatimonadales bacterium]|nr:hypothetical protein [Gemmatimonadales bacterium]